jgi:hypothetical protein
MLFKVNNRLLYMTSKRLAALVYALEDSGMIARSYSPPDQLIELQTTMIRNKPKEEPVSKEISFCARVTQMIQQYF